MKKYNIKIDGATPLVWNRDKIKLRNIVKKLKKDEIEEHEYKDWMMKAEVNNGDAIIPNSWIIGVLVNSAKETRIIPWFATSKNQTYTKYISNIKVSPSVAIVAGKSKDLWRKEGLFSSQGKSNMGGKVVRCHPTLDKWCASFVLIDTIGRMKKEELKKLLDHGGLAVGIGDQRYDNFGRFSVKEIKEIE